MRNKLLPLVVSLILVSKLFGVPFVREDSTWTRSLNGSWKFKLVDIQQTQLQEEFYQKDYNDSDWSDISVPSNWEMEGFTDNRYRLPLENLIGLYRKTLTIPEDWNGRQLILHFEAVAFAYTLWINGEKAGSFEKAFLPCQFDITKYALEGGPLTIALKVYPNHPALQFDASDDWALSGIFRDVYLFSPPQFHIDDYMVRTTVQPEAGTAEVLLETYLKYFRAMLIQHGNGEGIPKDEDFEIPHIEIETTLSDPRGQKVYSGRETVDWKQTWRFPTHKNRIKVYNAQYWNAEHPNLYRLQIDLFVGDKLTHEVSRNIGLREIQIEGNRLKLNGQVIKLRGVNRHGQYPDVGRALREKHWLEDIRMIKEANINTLRCAHYPPHPRFIELCDEYGLYVLNEISMGFGEELLSDPSIFGQMLTRADITIRRDRNSPSVISWSVGNENPLVPYLERTATFVKLLDPTRLAIYPGGNFVNDKNQLYESTGQGDMIDVYSKHYPDLEYIKGSVTEWGIDIPIMFTEINHALDVAFGNFKARWEIIENNENAAGAMIWEWADQGLKRDIRGREVIDSHTDIDALEKKNRSGLSDDYRIDANTTLDSHGVYGTDGIVYADRRPQTDYYEVKKVFSPVQIRESEIRLAGNQREVELHFINRYDFTDLNEVDFEWNLTLNGEETQTGTFALDCAPHDTCIQSIELDVIEKLSSSHAVLNIEMTDWAGRNIDTQAIQLIPESGAPVWHDILTAGLPKIKKLKLQRSDAGSDAVSMNGANVYFDEEGGISIETDDGKVLLEGPYLRLGHKPTMAEQHVFHRRKHTLIGPETCQLFKLENKEITKEKDKIFIEVSGEFYEPDNPAQKVMAQIRYTVSDGGWIDVDYTLSPRFDEGYATELGLAFHASPSIQNVSWIGNGPYPSFPGKKQLAENGIYEISRDYFYFNGNRMGVDAVWLTNKMNEGILLASATKNTGWEQTDKEGALSVFDNALVSGLGTKFRLPIELIDLSATENASGSLRMIALTSENQPVELPKLKPKQIH